MNHSPSESNLTPSDGGVPGMTPETLQEYGERVRDAIIAGNIALGNASVHYWNAGRMLVEVKNRLPHGRFTGFLHAQEIPHRNANRYMEFFKRYSTVEEAREAQMTPPKAGSDGSHVLEPNATRMSHLDPDDEGDGFDPGWQCGACGRRAAVDHRFCSGCGLPNPDQLSDPSPLPEDWDPPPTSAGPGSSQVKLGNDVWVNLDSTAGHIRIRLAEGNVREAGRHLANFRREMEDADWERLLGAAGIDDAHARRLIDHVTPPQPPEEEDEEDRIDQIFEPAVPVPPEPPNSRAKEYSATEEIRHNLKLGRRDIDVLEGRLGQIRHLTGHDGMDVRATETLEPRVAERARQAALVACEAANDLVRKVDQGKLLAARELGAPELGANMAQRIEYLRLSMPRRITRAFRDRLLQTVQDAWAELARMCRRTDVANLGYMADPESAAQAAVWGTRTKNGKPLFEPEDVRRVAQHYWTVCQLQEIAVRTGHDSVLHEPYCDGEGRRLQPWPAKDVEYVNHAGPKWSDD